MRTSFFFLPLFLVLTALPMTGLAAYGDYTHCGEGCSGMNPEYHECVNCCLETFQKVLDDCYAKCRADKSCTGDCLDQCQNSCDISNPDTRVEFNCPGWEKPGY